MTVEGRPFRALALDGGGMRGLYTAAFLDELANLFGKEEERGYPDVGKGFDLIAGTSTGGIIACGLAAGLSPKRIVELYRDRGPEIFKNPIPTSKAKKLWWAFRHANKPGNDNGALRAELVALFEDETLDALYERRGIALCIPAVNMANHSARVFKTPHLDRLKLDIGQSVVNVCMATSAAPIVLPIATVQDPNDEMHFAAYTDGGLWANNPVLVALVEALTLAESGQPIEILSLSTCAPPSGDNIQPRDAAWGLGNWVFGIGALETALDAQSSGYNHIAGLLAPHLSRSCVIHRVPPSPPSPQNAPLIGLDKATDDAAHVLVSLGKSDATKLFGEATRGLNDLGTFVANVFRAMPAHAGDDS